MSFRFRCTHCPATFDGIGKRTAHTRRKHQKSGKLSVGNNKQVLIMESPDGKFLCPSPDCGKAYAAMSFLAKHFKDKHSSQTTTPEPSNSFDSTAGDSSLSEGGGGGDIPPPGDRCSRDARFGLREEIGLSSSDAVSWPPSEGIEPYDVEADVGGGRYSSGRKSRARGRLFWPSWVSSKSSVMR